MERLWLPFHANDCCHGIVQFSSLCVAEVPMIICGGLCVITAEQMTWNVNSYVALLKQQLFYCINIIKDMYYQHQSGL